MQAAGQQGSAVARVFCGYQSTHPAVKTILGDCKPAVEGKRVSLLACILIGRVTFDGTRYVELVESRAMRAGQFFHSMSRRCFPGSAAFFRIGLLASTRKEEDAQHVFLKAPNGDVSTVTIIRGA